MLERMTRGAFLIILVAMIAAYAVQAAKTVSEPREGQPVERMYS